MKWETSITGKAKKQLKKLSAKVKDTLRLLRDDIEEDGPEQTNWPNYSKLHGRKGYYHCHLNKGKPCYVAVWRLNEKKINLVEVRYVGTHEKVNYKRIY